jgi:DNA-binding response OmpR family regulator
MERAPIRARILVVDDEAPIREYEASLLSEFGHEVLTAGEGYAALKLAREKQPDLVLLDVMMPEISGIEVCRELRADPQTREIRILVVSGVDARQTLEECLEAGADDFVTKPIDRLELMVRVRSMLRVRDIPDQEQRQGTYKEHIRKMRRQ